MKTPCRYEDELLDALERGYVNADLEAHVVKCTDCSELRMTAGALLDDRSAAMSEAPVPSSSAMWWRMQLRQKQEAEAMSRRSLLVGQGATLVVAFMLVAALLGIDFLVDVRQAVASLELGLPMIALAAMLLLAPIASWVAIRQK